MTKSNKVDVDLLLKLIQSSTSIAVVSDFLKKKQLPHSAGSWDDMFKLRLKPALANSTIQVSELIELLRTVEEYGRQHIFLFRTTPANAQAAMARSVIASALTKMNLSHLLVSPSIYDYPSQPTISDVRWVSATSDIELIIKEIQCREHYKLTDVKVTSSGMLKTYDKVQERGVNVARLHRNGNLEIRIAARSGSSQYHPDLLAFRYRIMNLLAMTGFAETSLRKAKNKLWTDRSSYDEKIRFSEISARNDDDFVLKAAGGNLESNVTSNEASVSSLANFIGMDGECESYNLWFSKAHTPSKRDIHFLLSGEVNEFGINANCTQDDYEYVLTELRTLNA